MNVTLPLFIFIGLIFFSIMGLTFTIIGIVKAIGNYIDRVVSEKIIKNKYEKGDLL